MTRVAGYRCALVGLWLIALSSATQAAKPEPPTEHPNVIGHVSQRVLDYLLQMAVEKQVDITDNVLGTSVRGAVVTRGRIVPLLVPEPHGGVLELRFTGTTNSPRMVGRNGPATIVSSALSDIGVRKRVLLDEQGLHLQPAIATANTQLRIQDITADRRVIERLAWRRANRSQGEAQAITSQRTKTRLQQEVDRDAAKPLAQAQDYFVKSFRRPLLEREALPKLFQFSTTQNYLRLLLQQCSHSQFDPPSFLPEIDPQEDIAVALHESSIGSIYEVFFAGQTAIDREVLHSVHLLTGEDPRPLRIHARTPRWSIRLADRKPMVVSFAPQNQVSFTFHLKTLRYGEREFNGAFTISARYALQKAEAAPRLARLGDVQIEGSTDSGSADELAEALGVLRTKFSAVFQPRFAFEGLVPPNGGIWSKIRRFELKRFETNDGWFVVSYRLPRPETLLANHPRK